MKYSSEQIGEIIKKERRKRGWSQAKLGEKIGLSDKQISKYEKGLSKPTPSVETLFKLCEIFDCELGYLLGEKGYSCGTKINTDIVATTGLSLEAIHSIQELTGVIESVFFRSYETNKIRFIINNFFTSNSFFELFECLLHLDTCIKNYENVFFSIIDSFGEEKFTEVLNLYTSSIDYEHNPDASQLTDEQIQIWNMINLAIDKRYDIAHTIKPAKYEVYETFRELIAEMYPFQLL